MKTAFVAGASGLIGSQLLPLLLSADRYSKVYAITRKPLPEHTRLIQLTADMADVASYADVRVDDVFCCLGTTIAVAGSKENFRKVDFVFPTVMAKSLRDNGASQYMLVSALGADKSSSIFYNRVKGEVEDAISQAGYRSLHIFRPSLLLGHREEKRTGEDAAKVFYKIFGLLIPKKYKGIDAGSVARAMLHYALQDKSGKHIHESGELQAF
ncbi:oxidoreductase [Chryseolinea sp. T2]|uniref:oxidoreductase n=1 Tax=Chryseolinea sp. T2 TaxID=3129255 RepID=UPI003077C224